MKIIESSFIQLSNIFGNFVYNFKSKHEKVSKMKEVLGYIDDNNDKFLDELVDFLKFPSVSTRERNKKDVLDCANWLKNNIIDSGFETVEVIVTSGHPIVYAEWLGAGADAPTVLIYGHYDVQPEDPINLWKSPPFEPTVRDGKLYGRGTADDKGQVFAHVKGTEAHFKKNGKLPVNVKLLIEGEEESGSTALMEFLPKNAEKLKCDTILISDTSWFADEIPSIVYSLRGIAVIEMTLTGPNRDLHSGQYGGAVPNPANELCKLIAKLHDEDGKVTIKDFYTNVVELGAEETKALESLPFNEKDYTEELGLNGLTGEKGYSTVLRASSRPTLDINGMFSGYTDEGHKSIIPSTATAKISMRLVPNQTWREITDKAISHIKSLVPEYMQIEIHGHHGGNPVIAAIDSPGVKAASVALETAFGYKTVNMREGGSIPIVEMFQAELKAPAVLMGLGLDSDNIHSPNEKFNLSHYFGGIKASALFLEEFAKVSK